MRILHVDTGSEMRGGQHQALLLLNALRDAGHHSILLAREGSPLSRSAAAQGFEVHPSEAKQVWLRSRRADIVHAHDARAHTIGVIAARTKLVVSRRVAFPVKRSGLSIWKYQRASRFLAVSQFVARELESAGIRPEKIDVVYDAVDTKNVLDREATKPWDASRPAIALASSDPMKGRALVQAGASLAGIPVIFSEDLIRDLRAASMFVYVTLAEGLGSAALLAMQMGVPVIASAVGGMTEIFTEGLSGLFVENHVQAVAAAMHRMRDEPGLAQRLIMGGRRRIQECFTREHLLQGTLASYQRALEVA